MGDASAVSMVLFAMIMVVVSVQLWLSRNNQYSLS
jgi:ABC-type sugar transport system permease subunit